MDIKLLIVAAVLAVILILGGVYLLGFKNWLVWAVSEAEKMLGSGTGQLKLRYVYDAAIIRFPILSKLIPFTMFSKMVDSALEVMRGMIDDNEKIAIAITDQAVEDYD